MQVRHGVELQNPVVRRRAGCVSAAPLKGSRRRRRWRITGYRLTLAAQSSMAWKHFAAGTMRPSTIEGLAKNNELGVHISRTCEKPSRRKK